MGQIFSGEAQTDGFDEQIIIHQIVPFINDSRSILKLRLNKNLDSIITNSKEIWNHISLFETSTEINEIIDKMNIHRTYVNNMNQLKFNTINDKNELKYHLPYFASIKFYSYIEKKYIENRINLFESENGNLDKDFINNIKHENYKFMNIKIDKYEGLINYGVPIETINKTNYYKRHKLKEKVKSRAKTAAFIAAAPVTVPIILYNLKGVLGR